MPPDIVIRPEATVDTVAITVAITAVTIAAFATLEISQHTEQFIVKALHDAGALVAELDAQVVDQSPSRPSRCRTARPTGMASGRCRCCRHISDRASARR
jgi:putative acetyltransferase